MMCQQRFISCNKSPTLVKDVEWRRIFMCKFKVEISVVMDLKLLKKLS